MSDTAKQLFEGLKELAPGLKNFGAEVSAEFSRLGTQGAMELASALFNATAAHSCLTDRGNIRRPLSKRRAKSRCMNRKWDSNDKQWVQSGKYEPC